MDQSSTTPTRNRRRRFALLSIFFIVAAAAILGHILRPRPVPAPRVLSYTPQQAAAAQGHIENFRDQLLKSDAPEPTISVPAKVPRITNGPKRQPILSSVSVPVRIPLTEQDINTVFATNSTIKAILRARGVQAVQVTLRPPNLFMIRAALVIRKRPVNAQIDGRLLPFPPTLIRIVATHVQAGSVLLPPALVTVEANKIIARFARKLHGRLPFIVQSVYVDNKTLVLTGVRTQKRTQDQGA